MRELLEAIKSKIDGHAGIHDVLTGGYHVGYAQGDTSDAEPAMPYLVASDVTNLESDMDTGDHVTEAIAVRFDVYSTVAKMALQIVEALEGLFCREPDEMEWFDGRVLFAFKTNGDFMPDPDRTESGQTVWRAMIVIQFEIQRRLESAILEV